MPVSLIVSLALVACLVALIVVTPVAIVVTNYIHVGQGFLYEELKKA